MANILIVDNDQSNISSIAQLLKTKGHSLSYATTSAQVMKLLLKKQTDLMIIGVELDGEDGRELSRVLQTESPFKNIPVILTSPFYHTEHEVRSFYCDDLLTIPLEADILTTSIETLLSKESTKAKKQLSVSE